MKNVLLLGDSIRMSYEPLVKEKLLGAADVYGPAENGRWAGYTLNSLRFWLPSMPKPDIVHWNNGLWDMGDDYNLGRPFSLPEEYVSALERTITVLRKLNGDNVKIIMATTTPTAHTDPSKPHNYNNLLTQTAQKHNIEINDLFTAIAADIPQNISKDHIHLSEKGVEIAADTVVKRIRKYL
jgi:lysophospholipase L1-like esterase